MNKRLLLILAAVVAVCATASAQGRKAVRINEVVVEATPDGIADEYGAHNAWIELFNSNFAPVDISSLYITTDRTHKNRYPVPLGDVKTHVEKRQHAIFFADGEPNKGTFHTNFTLTPGAENYIAILDADGSLIDEVTVPATVLAGQSWARTEDGAGEWGLRTGGEHDYITPSSANIIKDSNKKIEEFEKRDANGFGMTVLAMCIVFSALLILSICFYGIGKIGSFVARFNKARSHAGTETVKASDARKVTHDSGEEIAAIVLALHEHLDAHDTESTVLTINKVRRAYSPWSSKIYNLRELPHRNARR